MLEVVLLVLAVGVGITMAMRMDVEPRAPHAAGTEPAPGADRAPNAEG
jgi:hypothetical protein